MPAPHRRAAAELRAIFGGMAVASILTAAVGCDKHAEAESRTPPRMQTSLAGKPTVLFLVFGDRSDPRLLPIATVGHGRVTPITLDADGWRKFDQLYFKAGTEVAVYRDGGSVGSAVIQRGMWGGGAPLYKLPGCRALRPLAAAKLDSLQDFPMSLELLATSDPVPSAAARPSITPADLDSARAFAARAAQHAGLTTTARGELDLTVHALHSGVSAWPTLVATYMEKGSGSGFRPRHLLAIGDSSANGYAATYVHSPKDSVPELRRLIDHVDLTGDGVDEIVLEGWSAGSDSYLLILRYANGGWRELARGANSWCADLPRR